MSRRIVLDCAVNDGDSIQFGDIDFEGEMYIATLENGRDGTVYLSEADVVKLFQHLGAALRDADYTLSELL